MVSKYQNCTDFSGLMPCPSIDPKLFWTGPNYLGPVQNGSVEGQGICASQKSVQF